MKKRLVDEGLKERVQKAIEKRIEELKARQYDRAETIEKSLSDYEKNIRIRSVNDYVSLIKTQRLLVGLHDERSEIVIIDENEIAAVEQKTAKRMEKIRCKE